MPLFEVLHRDRVDSPGSQLQPPRETLNEYYRSR